MDQNPAAGLLFSFGVAVVAVAATAPLGWAVERWLDERRRSRGDRDEDVRSLKVLLFLIVPLAVAWAACLACGAWFVMAMTER